MADLIQLRQGHPPWEPTPDSVVVAQYRYYDAPLAGVISQDGQEFLFACLAGQDEILSLWWFAPIDPRIRERIEKADLDEAIFALMHSEFHGWSRLALVTTGLGIVDFEDVEDLPDGAGLKVAHRILVERLDRLSSTAHELEFA